MKLAPAEPPGRITRKARQFEAEIAQLRAQGYSLDAIRRALASVGVQVSISTVRREATRRAAPAVRIAIAAPGGAVRQGSSQLTTRVATAPAEADALVAPSDRASAKDQAEAILRSQITNTLLRTKEHP